jgi:hypothetical protein
MGRMKEAPVDLESYGSGGNSSYKKVAAEHGIMRSALIRRDKSQPFMSSNQHELSRRQETELLRKIEDFSKILQPTRAMIRDFASRISEKDVSESWIAGFVNRHGDHLVSHGTSARYRTRREADYEIDRKPYLDFMHRKMKEYDIEPGNTYNMDEKGFMIGATGRSKRVFSREMWEREDFQESLQHSPSEWVTLLACICADGSALPPSLIYQAVTGALRPTWVQDIEAGNHQILVTSSPSGWANNDVGFAWLEQVFNPYTQKKAGRSRRLLIVDGNGFHLTMDFIGYCVDNGILVAILPPHSTDTLQPLDVLMFRLLATAYSDELSGHLRQNQGLLSVKKGDFFPLFWKAWVHSFSGSEQVILKSFEVTGIWPMDSDIMVLRSLYPSENEDSSSLNSSEYNSRRMERLVQTILRENCRYESTKLSRSVHDLSVQNELLYQGFQTLIHALVSKEKNKKKVKTLLLQQHRASCSRAAFRLTTNDGEAIAREVVRKRDETEKKLPKVEENKLKITAQSNKEKKTAEKQIERMTAKMAEERTRQKYDQNSANPRPLSRIDKRKAEKPPQDTGLQTKRRNQTSGASGGVQVPEPIPALPLKKTRSGREVKPPRIFE